MRLHDSDTTTLLVTLSSSELARAARLGGLVTSLDDQIIDDTDIATELVQFFAKRGLLDALSEHYAREYPAHYPEDVDASYWATFEKPAPIKGDFIHQWRGKITW